MPLVRVPATTANLGPGFDTLGMALELYDEILIEEATSFEIDITGEGANTIPRGPENIVFRAARTVFERAGKTNINIRLKMYNKIPVARGLGSSAAALVGGLTGANALLGYPLSNEDLIRLAAEMEGHPDNVAPAVLGGLVISVIDNSEVYCTRLEPPKELSTIVAIPKFTLPTRLSRSVLPDSVKLQDAVFNISRVSMMIAAFNEGNLELMGKMMVDRLHQPYRIPLVAGLNEVFDEAKKAGALAVALSGSGPSVIAFCRGRNLKVGPAMIRAFARYGVDAEVKVLSPCSQGARVIKT